MRNAVLHRRYAAVVKKSRGESQIDPAVGGSNIQRL